MNDVALDTRPAVTMDGQVDRLPGSNAAAAEVEEFMSMAIQLGAEFLACGGPVTRLESQLTDAGSRRGYETHVHATPSAISIYCHLRELKESYGRAGRIQSFGVDLGRLHLVDRLLNQFARGRVRTDQILRWLEHPKLSPRQLNLGSHLLCVLGIGLGSALLSGADFQCVVPCGLFTVAARVLITLLTRMWKMNAIFAEFLTCSIAFFGAAALSDILSTPSYLLSIGTLVYVVPGLLLTSAISEIVDQNYLSGTVRLLKAFSTFLAMAVAFYMVTDIGRSLGLETESIAVPAAESGMLAQMLGAALIIFCSSIEFRAPPKAILGIMFCGLAGMLSYRWSYSPGNLVKPHFVAAFVISLISFELSRRTRQPSQIYSVPSVLILAPGMLAFTSFGFGNSSNVDLPSILRAVLISLSIVLGLAAGRLRLRSSDRLSLW